MSVKNIIGKRLRAARERTEYSQKKLGIALGVDPFSASPRINHYEQGRHQPDFQTVQKLAKLLNVPTAYIYAKEDDLAEMILAYSELTKGQKQKALKSLKK